MRQLIVAGNWKMFTDLAEAKNLANQIADQAKTISGCQIVLCPPFVNLQAVNEVIKGTKIALGAQNVYHEPQGAFTGEISTKMLAASGCKYVIVGHSERRQIFSESNEFINQKVKAVLKENLIPIFCLGETLKEREENQAFPVIKKQLFEGLDGIKDEIVTLGKKIVIAYEPVWAIGTGHVATPAEAQSVHAFIRHEISAIFSREKAEEIQIQYGGSVKPENIQELIGQKDIDGALVGGASLKAESFVQIVNLCQEAIHA